MTERDLIAMYQKAGKPLPKALTKRRRPRASALIGAAVVDRADDLMGLIRQIRPSLAETLVRDHRFHETRKWELDLACPRAKVAVEVDGGRYSHGGGRHSTDGDRDKMNAAQVRGWTVLRYSPQQVTADPMSVIDEIEATVALGMAKEETR